MNFSKILALLLVKVSQHLLVLHGFTQYDLEFLWSLEDRSLNEMRVCKTSRGLSKILLKSLLHSSVLRLHLINALRNQKLTSEPVSVYVSVYQEHELLGLYIQRRLLYRLWILQTLTQLPWIRLKMSWLSSMPHVSTF